MLSLITTCGWLYYVSHSTLLSHNVTSNPSLRSEIWEDFVTALTHTVRLKEYHTKAGSLRVVRLPLGFLKTLPLEVLSYHARSLTTLKPSHWKDNMKRPQKERSPEEPHYSTSLFYMTPTLRWAQLQPLFHWNLMEDSAEPSKPDHPQFYLLHHKLIWHSCR
jgi:hypothetical protein